MADAGQFPLSTAVVEYFTERVVELQQGNKLRALEQPGGNEDVAGAVVRAYGFNYVEGEDIAQGIMSVELGGNRRSTHPVTVVIMGGTVEDGRTGARIVEETAKISDFSFWMLDAHFTTFCDSIQRHIVVYEKFLGHFDFDRSYGDEPSFFTDDESQWQLTPVWVSRMRQLIELLDYARTNEVTHGGLNDRRSYVTLTDGSIKLIEVARNTIGYTEGKDLADLRIFLKEEPFFDVKTTSDDVPNEWGTFDLLLGSNLVTEFFPGWKAAVLGHPVLQESAEDMITAWRGVHKSKEELTIVEAVKLANLLLKDYWPDLCYKESKVKPTKKGKEKVVVVDNKKRRHSLRKIFRDWFKKDSKLIDKLFDYRTPEQPLAYCGEYFHLEAIDLAQNMILHGQSYMPELSDHERMVEEVRTHFGSFLSMAYYLLHTLRQHENPLGPFVAPVPPPAPPRGQQLDIMAYLKGKQVQRGKYD